MCVCVTTLQANRAHEYHCLASFIALVQFGVLKQLCQEEKPHWSETFAAQLGSQTTQLVLFLL
jgi:hypothetical protein